LAFSQHAKLNPIWQSQSIWKIAMKADYSLKPTGSDAAVKMASSNVSTASLHQGMIPFIQCRSARQILLGSTFHEVYWKMATGIVTLAAFPVKNRIESSRCFLSNVCRINHS